MLCKAPNFSLKFLQFMIKYIQIYKRGVIKLYKIAIITSKPLHNFFKESLKDEMKKNTIDFYIHEEIVKTCEMYSEIEDKYDGFLTSGEIINGAIDKYVGSVKKPILSISSDLASYYEIFLKLIYKNKDLNFNRVYVDFLDWFPQSNSIVDYLSNGTYGKLLYGFRKSLKERSLNDIVQTDRKVLDKHINLWKEGKIDVSITRSSNILQKLDEENVNYIFLMPNKLHAIESFGRLMKEIELKKFQENSSVAIYMKVDEKYDLNNVIKAIYEYRNISLTNLIINHYERNIEILSTYKEVLEMTNNLEECSLGKYIFDNTYYQIDIGYGIANTIYQAIKNSISAFKEAQNYSVPASFVHSDNGNVIGPLNSNNIKVINNIVTPQINNISKKTGLSTLTIQKLFSIKDKLEENEITISILSDYLGISHRNANRILSKLVEANVATILYTKQTATKGRPKKVFSFLFDKI